MLNGDTIESAFLYGAAMSFPADVKEKALVACARRCCLCHRFVGLKIELHHIDQKTEEGKNIFKNCIPLCFDCHADMRSYDHKHPKGTKYTPPELIRHRDNWYERVASGATGRETQQQETRHQTELVTAWMIPYEGEQERRDGIDRPVALIDPHRKVWVFLDRKAEREDLPLSAAVALKRKIAPALEAAAKTRQRAHGGTAPGRAGQVARGETGRAADQVAKVTGKSRRTMEKAEAVVAAAEADPAKYGPLVEDMDRNGADGAYKRLMNMRAAAAANCGV